MSENLGSGASSPGVLERAPWLARAAGVLLAALVTWWLVAPASASLSGPRWIAFVAVQGALVAVLLVRPASPSRGRQLQRVTHALRETVSGRPLALAELNTTGPAASAEVAALVEAAAALGTALEPILTLAQNAGFSLGARSAEILDVSATMATNAENSAEKAATAAAAADQMSSRIATVAEGVDQLAETIRDIARHASDASATAVEASADAVGARDAVADLEDASKRVDEVVRFINTVAGQTHLLALNATIEAARAGEAGRGFAVVASEVRQLANETSKATESANKSVEDIQLGSFAAGKAMAAIVETIRRVSANQVSIAASVEQQTMASNTIRHNAAEAAAGVVNIAAGVSAIVGDARVIAYAGGQAAAAAVELAAVGDDFEVALKRFSLSLVVPAKDAPIVKTVATTDSRGNTIVANTDFGKGLNELDYAGHWSHSKGNNEGDRANSYSGFPGDTVTLRFSGSRIKLYSVKGPNHGIVSVSIDGGPQVDCDQYRADRVADLLLWTGEGLSPGEHVLTYTITGRKNPASPYVWITLERIEISP